MAILTDAIKEKFRDLLDLMTIENPGPYVTADQLLKTIQFGDLIQFRRTGYVHWGMYCGNESIIHFRNTGELGILPRTETTEDQSIENSNVTTASVEIIETKQYNSEDTNKSDGTEPKQNNKKDRKKKNEVLIGIVEMMKLVDVANSDMCRVNNREKMAERWAKREPKNQDEKFIRRTAEEAVKAARMMLLVEIEYDLKNKNCEHICTKWKYNISDSDQINQAYNAAKASAAAAAMGGAAAAAGVGAKVAEEEAEKKRAEAEQKARDEANKLIPRFP